MASVPLAPAQIYLAQDEEFGREILRSCRSLTSLYNEVAGDPFLEASGACG